MNLLPPDRSLSIKTANPNKTAVLLGFLDGASRRDRTDDLMITNQVLYQLSYAGVIIECVT